jgi:hypothetical protein
LKLDKPPILQPVENRPASPVWATWFTQIYDNLNRLVNGSKVVSGVQAVDYYLTGATANATPTEIFIGGVSNTRMGIPSDSTVGFEIKITARRTDADNESAFYTLTGCIDNNAGTTALVGSVTKVVVAEDTAGWDVAATADNTNDALALTVTGALSTTVRWYAHARLFEVVG